MKKTLSKGKINIVLQLALISLFMLLFFVAFRFSPSFGGWEKRVQDVAARGLVISTVVTAALFAVYLIAGGFPKPCGGKTWMYALLMGVVHYCIRIRMIGTLQMDEGLICYRSLNHIVENPSMLIDNIWEAGKLADRNAYGYNFFALMGEFAMPGKGVGFQWVQMLMGIAASICLFLMFRRLFPRIHEFTAWLAAFTVSVEPMFLGLSTTCGLEYGMTVFLIFALCACVNKQYLLMVFWLLMLGSTKGSGMIMALCFVGAFFSGIMLKVLIAKRKGTDGDAVDNSENDDGDDYNYKTGALAVIAMAAALLLVYGIIKVCAANGIAFSGDYIKYKMSQLFVLNFSWIWVIVVVVGIFMASANLKVRRTNRLDIIPVFVAVGCYFIYVMYLLAYPKATLPRYNMPAYVLFAMFGVCFLLKLFEKAKAIMPTLAFLAVIMLMESFVTIDPLSAEIFTNLNTNGFPMVYTAKYKSELELMNDNPGDYAYYNYQYTFVDKAIGEIIEASGDEKVLFVSSASFIESQFRSDELRWGAAVERKPADGMLKGIELPKKGIFIEIPWYHGDTEGTLKILSEYYDISEPFYSEHGYSGTVKWYNIRLKSE